MGVGVGINVGELGEKKWAKVDEGQNEGGGGLFE